MVSNRLPILTTRVSHVNKLCWSDAVLKKIRGLDAKDPLVIFTPVVPSQEPSRRNSDGEVEAIDPFECFGRALSKHHLRIRHVPYVPQVGMTDTHWQWIQHATALIVVVCEPAGATKTSAQGVLWNQARFAETAITEFRDRPDNLFQPAAALLLCGDGVSTDIEEYGVVMHCGDYHRTTLEEAASSLFAA